MPSATRVGAAASVLPSVTSAVAAGPTEGTSRTFDSYLRRTTSRRSSPAAIRSGSPSISSAPLCIELSPRTGSSTE